MASHTVFTQKSVFSRIFFPTSSNRYVHLRLFSDNLKPQISTPTCPLQVHQSTFSPCTPRSKIFCSKVAFVDCREEPRNVPLFSRFSLLPLKPALLFSFSLLQTIQAYTKHLINRLDEKDTHHFHFLSLIFSLFLLSFSLSFPFFFHSPTFTQSPPYLTHSDH